MTKINEMVINFNKISKPYQKTDQKPDKVYSMLPTILKAIGKVQGKMILDIGAGSGFFTREIAKKGAKEVLGIDLSKKQIALAKRYPKKNIKYAVGNMFSYDYPKSDVINAPFVLNYPHSVSQLQKLLKKFYNSLNNKGKLVSIVDFPDKAFNEELTDKKKNWGAIKKIKGKINDGSKIEMDFYNRGKFICKVESTYFTKETFEKSLKKVGFIKIKWHKPIISNEGKKKLGPNFWNGYVNNCELGYFTAIKA